MTAANDLHEHLLTGVTTVCRCWALSRQDGAVLGFTDHDMDLTFDGITFRADSGMTARELQQTTGLSVDNTEAFGALSHSSVREEDILSGRYDGCDVVCWLVNWAAVEARQMQFRGSIGEVTVKDGAFIAELRGLSEALNRPQGRVYLPSCSAVLGDKACGVDLSAQGYTVETVISGVTDGRIFEFSDELGPAEGWFTGGRLEILDGDGAGLVGHIQRDQIDGAVWKVYLWDGIRVGVDVGQTVRLVAGCDRLAETCRLKFDNFLNFRGFPHIPGDDWLLAYPRQGDGNDGGAL